MRTFCGSLWEVLPTEPDRTGPQAKRLSDVRDEHFFNRRFKDDAEHSEWWLRQQAKKK